MDGRFLDKIERLKLHGLLRKGQLPHRAEKPIPNSTVGLLSLPSELLDRIIHHITDTSDDELNFIIDRRTQFKSLQEEPGIRTTYRLRLVCKQLCDRASRAFVPVLRIHLSESSLARAEEIMCHPRASQNIRGIELVLDYRSGSFASDFDLFFQIKINELYKLSDEWEEVKNEMILGDYEDWTPEMLDEEANRIFNAEIKDVRIVDDPDYDPAYRHDVLALERWQTVDAAWHKEQNNTEVEYTRDDPKRKLLREGFRRFHAIHQEQHRLVTSREFTSRVSAICDCLPSLGFLIFNDRELATKGPEEEWTDLKSRVMFDDNKMLEMLSNAVPWSNAVPEATSAFAPAHAIASKLIWDIPTALYGAGIRLHGLHIRGFPLPGNYDSSRAGDVSPTDADCDNALTRLKSFYTSTQEKVPNILRTNTICET